MTLFSKKIPTYEFSGWASRLKWLSGSELITADQNSLETASVIRLRSFASLRSLDKQSTRSRLNS